MNTGVFSTALLEALHLILQLIIIDLCCAFTRLYTPTLKSISTWGSDCISIYKLLRIYNVATMDRSAESIVKYNVANNRNSKSAGAILIIKEHILLIKRHVSGRISSQRLSSAVSFIGLRARTSVCMPQIGTKLIKHRALSVENTTVSTNIGLKTGFVAGGV